MRVEFRVEKLAHDHWCVVHNIDGSWFRYLDGKHPSKEVAQQAALNLTMNHQNASRRLAACLTVAMSARRTKVVILVTEQVWTAERQWLFPNE